MHTKKHDPTPPLKHAWTIFPVLAAAALTLLLCAAGGAALANHLSDGDPLITAAGAGGGLLLGETLNYAQDKKVKKSFTEGYDKGRSDAVKQQYWVARDNQRPKADDGYEETYYEIDVPQSDRDGVRREPTKRVIRVVMPKEES